MSTQRFQSVCFRSLASLSLLSLCFLFFVFLLTAKSEAGVFVSAPRAFFRSHFAQRLFWFAHLLPSLLRTILLPPPPKKRDSLTVSSFLPLSLSNTLPPRS